jgi:hypothetical protein
VKIYVLPTSERARPSHQNLIYPAHNSDFGVEQDFLNYLNTNRSMLVASDDKADYHYLPVFWTRWHLNHDYGRSGISDLQAIVDNAIIDDKKTFTVCQYDDGPSVNIGRATIFLSSRKTAQGKDIPLLCNRHSKPWFVKKKYLASFAGRISTHPIRSTMLQALSGRPDVCLRDCELPTKKFVQQLCESRAALAPRGYGGSSFRFFEAMQLGVPPILFGEMDTRPFKNYIPWEEVSFYAKDERELVNTVNLMDTYDLDRMGKRASEIYHRDLTYQRWCRLVIKELETINHASKTDGFQATHSNISPAKA